MVIRLLGIFFCARPITNLYYGVRNENTSLSCTVKWHVKLCPFSGTDHVMIMKQLPCT